MPGIYAGRDENSSCPPYSPAGTKSSCGAFGRARERGPFRRTTVSRKRETIFYCKNSEHPEYFAGGTRKAAKATAACGGNREPEQGPRSQRRRPAPRGAGRCGHRNPYVPAVLRPGRARQSSGLSGRARGRGAPSGAPQPYRTCKAVFLLHKPGPPPSSPPEPNIRFCPHSKAPAFRRGLFPITAAGPAGGRGGSAPRCAPPARRRRSPRPARRSRRRGRPSPDRGD